MPIYEYQCSSCDHRLETLQKVSDAPHTECPACYRPDLKKLMSAASFRLKGGGWYETDFKTGDKRQLAESDSSGKETQAGDDGAASNGGGAKEDNGKSARSNELSESTKSVASARSSEQSSKTGNSADSGNSGKSAGSGDGKTGAARSNKDSG